MQANLMTRVLMADQTSKRATSSTGRTREGWGAKYVLPPIKSLWRGRLLPIRETWGIARTRRPQYLGSHAKRRRDCRSAARQSRSVRAALSSACVSSPPAAPTPARHLRPRAPCPRSQAGLQRAAAPHDSTQIKTSRPCANYMLAICIRPPSVYLASGIASMSTSI